MKTPSPANFLLRSSLALVLALAIWSPVQAQSTEPPMGGKMMMEGKMMERCQAMMAEMKAQDAALAELVVQMNGAPEDKKLGQLAAVVTRMVEQRVAMNAHMKMMMEEMMKSMPMGKNPGSPEPMMKGMDESTGEHPKSAS